MEKLDLKAVKKRIVKTVSTEEALKDAVPIEWPSDVIEGKKKVIITSGKPVQDSLNKYGVKMKYV